MTENELLQLGKGYKLSFLGRAANMVSISLSSPSSPYDYVIHISAKCELLYQGNVLTNTADIFEEVRPNVTRFDEKVQGLMDEGTEFFLQEMNYDYIGCLHAKFSNSFEVHSLFEASDLDEDCEMWRVFFRWKAEPHLVATQKGISLVPCEESQAELDRLKIYFSSKTTNQGPISGRFPRSNG